MNEAEYKRLRRRLDEKYREDCAALDRVWQLAREHKDGGSASVSIERGKVQGAVLLILEQMDGEFKLEDVVERIRLLNPELAAVENSSVSTVLRRLEGLPDGQLEMVSRGRGKRPTLYRRKVVAN